MKRIITAAVILLLFASVSWADFKVGGVSFKLVKPSSTSTFFEGTVHYEVDGTVASDANGCLYGLPFAPNDGKFPSKLPKGVTVQTDLVCEEHGVKECLADPKEIPLMVKLPADAYDASMMTIKREPNDADAKVHTIKYLLNGEPLVEFTGTVSGDFIGDRKPMVTPYRGTFSFACGERWGLRMNNSLAALPKLVEASPEAKSAGKKINAEGAKKKEAFARKLTSYRKSIKKGMTVHVDLDPSKFERAKAVVLERSGNLLKVELKCLYGMDPKFCQGVTIPIIRHVDISSVILD